MRFIHRVALPILFVMTVSSLGYAQGTFQGLWESSFGLLDLKQDGMRVSGAYHCCGVGRLEGDIIGNQLEFSWQDAVFGTGWGVFVMSADGERLDGLWGFESDAEPRGEWLAEKFHEPNFIGARTLWSVGGEEMQLGAALQGSAELYIAEDRVVGVLEGVYVLNDPNQRSGFPIFNFLGCRSHTEVANWR